MQTKRDGNREKQRQGDSMRNKRTEKDINRQKERQREAETRTSKDRHVQKLNLKTKKKNRQLLSQIIFKVIE